MCRYLKIIGPVRGRPPDLYPLHHGISAPEIGGGGGVLTTTPSTRSHSGGDRAFCVNESSKSDVHRLRSLIRPATQRRKSPMRPYQRPSMEGTHPSSFAALSPPPYTPQEKPTLRYSSRPPTPTPTDDKYSKRASTRDIGITPTKYPTLFMAGAHHAIANGTNWPRHSQHPTQV